MTSCIDSGWLIVAIGSARREIANASFDGRTYSAATKLALRDRDGALRNGDDVAGPRDAPYRARDDRDEVVARANERRSHRNRHQARRRFRPRHDQTARCEAHVRSSSTISSSLYLREPFSRTTSSGRTCSRSQRAACAFVPICTI